MLAALVGELNDFGRGIAHKGLDGVNEFNCWTFVFFTALKNNAIRPQIAQILLREINIKPAEYKGKKFPLGMFVYTKLMVHVTQKNIKQIFAKTDISKYFGMMVVVSKVHGVEVKGEVVVKVSNPGLAYAHVGAIALNNQEQPIVVDFWDQHRQGEAGSKFKPGTHTLEQFVAQCLDAKDPEAYVSIIDFIEV